MRINKGTIAAIGTMLLVAVPALADKYSDTLNLFKNAGQSASFVGKSFGYALFPTIGKGGLGIGGAHGEGRVYEGAKYVGDTKMTQLSIGFQAGGQAFSQIIFFADLAVPGHYKVYIQFGELLDRCQPLFGVCLI